MRNFIIAVLIHLDTSFTNDSPDFCVLPYGYPTLHQAAAAGKAAGNAAVASVMNNAQRKSAANSPAAVSGGGAQRGAVGGGEGANQTTKVVPAVSPPRIYVRPSGPTVMAVAAACGAAPRTI